MTESEYSEAEAYGREGTGTGLLVASVMAIIHEWIVEFNLVIAAFSMALLGGFLLWVGAYEANKVAEEYVDNSRDQIRWTDEGPVLRLYDGTEVHVRPEYRDGEPTGDIDISEDLPEIDD